MHLKTKNFHLVIESNRYVDVKIYERNLGLVLNWYNYVIAPGVVWKRKTGVMLTVFFGIGEWCIEAWYLWRHKEGR